MKRFLCLLLVGLMSVTSIDVMAFANEQDFVEVTEENVYEIVNSTIQSWVTFVEPGKELNVVDIKEVYNATTGEMEYTASLFDNVTPYGYVVVGVCDDEMVVLEANVDKGQEGLYTAAIEEIVEEEGRPRRNIEADETITKFGPMSYGVKYKDKNGRKKCKDKNGKSVEISDDSKEDNKSVAIRYAKAQSIFIKNESWKSTKYEEIIKEKLKCYLGKGLMIDSSTSKAYTGQYACGIQALAHIAYMWNMTSYRDRYKYKKTYNTLWEYCKTEEYSVDDKGCSYGENYSEYDLGKGFIKYARENGYPKAMRTHINSPSVSEIRENIKNNKPILMLYEIDTLKGESAHAISVVGYVRAKKISSGNTWNYLMVYDGWNSSVSYLNYTCVDLNYCDIVCFNMKK